MRLWQSLSIVLALVFVSLPALADVSAKALESRLYAPCCWGGTLDIHDSELARELRKEIETRLGAGESADAIQTSFVERYGDRVLAARSERTSGRMGLALGGVFVLAAGALAVVFSRWRRNSALDGEVVAPAGEPRDALDDRVDAELAEMDE